MGHPFPDESLYGICMQEYCAGGQELCALTLHVNMCSRSFPKIFFHNAETSYLPFLCRYLSVIELDQDVEARVRDLVDALTDCCQPFFSAAVAQQQVICYNSSMRCSQRGQLVLYIDN